ncbi:MAG: GNAT family N-acetyltransferase [Pseudomonadales bacterium]|nr:GNAT family N-acetyltransferase [Pseudomonadales bacterium]
MGHIVSKFHSVTRRDKSRDNEYEITRQAHNNMEITQIKTEQQIRSCYELMAVLRPHLIKTDFPNQVSRQMEQGYQLRALEDANDPLALIGYRLVENLIFGKFLYVDDLVTAPNHKRKGYAGQLLDWAIQFSIDEGCQAVQLDSGFQNADAHRLYLNKGFQLSAHHFRKSLATLR